MKENKLPESFGLRVDRKNPLWNDYVIWLHNKGAFDIDGKGIFTYWGYKSGRKHFSTVLTLEEWDVIVNPKETEFLLPEKWCIRISCKEISDYCNKYGEAPPYQINKNHFAHFPALDVSCTTSDIVEDGYTEITFEQFQQHVLKEPKMKEKEIIGYKLKEDCLKYKQACNEIVYTVSSPLGIGVTYIDVNKYTGCVNLLKKAGVLDLWFEPVYKDYLDYKVGDHLYCIKTFKMNQGDIAFTQGKIYKTIESEDDYSTLLINDENEPHYMGHDITEWFRIATPEEVKASLVPNITIRGHKVRFAEKRINIGCQSFSNGQIINFYEAQYHLFANKLTHFYLDINGDSVCVHNNQLEDIYNYVKNK